MFLTVPSSHLSINTMKLQQPVNNTEESSFEDNYGFLLCVCVCNLSNIKFPKRYVSKYFNLPFKGGNLGIVSEKRKRVFRLP